MRIARKQILSIIIAILFLMNCPVFAQSPAPVAENMELTTYRNVSVGGKLCATFPQGEVTKFIITTQPRKGTVTVDEDGYFIYTPEENKKGRDYFGYKAVDSMGQESQEATVILRILRKEPSIRYDDTMGYAWDYAACKLAEDKLFTGIQVGENYYFRANNGVSREEFTALCSAATNREYISSHEVDDGTPLTFQDAAVILNELIELTAAPCFSTDVLSGIDEDSAQAVSNVYSCGIFQEHQRMLSDVVTRKDAAEMILRTVDILNKR